MCSYIIKRYSKSGVCTTCQGPKHYYASIYSQQVLRTNSKQITGLLLVQQIAPASHVIDRPVCSHGGAPASSIENARARSAGSGAQQLGRGTLQAAKTFLPLGELT